MRRLLFTTGLTVIAFLLWSRHDGDPRNPDVYDRILAYGVVVTGLTTILVMMFRDRWSARALGLWLVKWGTVFLYGGLILTWWTGARPEWTTNALRAVLTVGCPLVMFGSIVWMREGLRRKHAQRGGRWFGRIPETVDG